MAQKDLISIDIYSPRYGEIKFPAFIESLSDGWSSNWKTDQLYGFQDPVGVFIGTTRKIALTFNIIAPSIEDSKEYQESLNKIVQSLYPIYNNDIVPTTAPIFGLRVTNLVHGNGKGFLFGFLDGFSLEPSFSDTGIFSEGGKLYPISWKASFNFNVIHHERPGFKGNQKGKPFTLGGVKQYPVSIGGGEPSTSPGSPTPTATDAGEVGLSVSAMVGKTFA